MGCSPRPNGITLIGLWLSAEALRRPTELRDWMLNLRPVDTAGLSLFRYISAAAKTIGARLPELNRGGSKRCGISSEDWLILFVTE
jgi:hypothetical protein